jgi:anti-sigma factor RsiW
VPTCRDMSELVTDYFERRLPVTAWLGARWHLLQCDACRHYYDQMRRTIRLLAASALSPPGAEVEDRVLRAVRDGVPPRPAPGE